LKLQSIYLTLLLLVFASELSVFSFSGGLEYSDSIYFKSYGGITLWIDTPLYNHFGDSTDKLMRQCELIIDSLNFQPVPELLNAYIISGKYFILKYEPDNALKSFTAAEKILNAADDNYNFLYGIIYHYIGSIYYYKLRYERAIKYYEKALNIAKKYDILVDYIGINYGHLARIYYILDDYDIAIKYNRKHLHSPGINILNKIVCYRRLSNCFYAKSDIKKAEYYITLAEKNTIKHYGIEYPELLIIYITRSYIYKKAGNNSKCLYYLNKSLEIADLHYPVKSDMLAYVLRNLGRFYYKTSDYEKALYTLQKALIAVTIEFNDTNIRSNPDINDTHSKMLLLRLLKFKAYAFYYYYEQITGDISDLKASLACYELSVKLQEKIHATFIDEKTKLNFVAKQKKNLNNTIEVALDVYEETREKTYIEKALVYSEKSKSAVLLSYLNDQKDKNFAGIPDSLLSAEKAFRREIANLDFRINSENDTEFIPINEYERLKSRYLELLREEEELISYYENNFPEYYNLKYNTSATSLDQIQKILEKNQAVLEYTITWKELYTFVITRDNISVHMQDIDSIFLKSILSLRKLLSENKYGNYDNNDFSNFINTSYGLYKILIHPVKELIKDKNLILVPDEALNLIPFEVLITNDSVTNAYADFSELPYLFKQYPVSYSYSASLLINQKQNRHPGKKSAAFIPKYKGMQYGNNVLNDSINEEVYRLMPLFGAEEEANYFSRFYKGRVFSDNQANEENFKKFAVDYNVIHLAMHTIIDDRNPMYSKMVFTPGEDKSEDGLLHTFELYGMKLKANLIALSSCNTGYGKMQHGEGLLSLARGFLYAGCPGLLLTQWSVTDKASAELIRSFYYYLSKGKSKDRALQHAKMNYLKYADPVKTHPYFWAGYIVIGDTCPLPARRKYKYLIILIAISIVTSGYFIKRKKPGSTEK
jgi:CHAT domain-containing protein/antirestriction protein